MLVLHAWWGLNDTMKEVCKRLAASGFACFAPDLYHGKVADTIPDAETLAGALDANHIRPRPGSQTRRLSSGNVPAKATRVLR